MDDVEHALSLLTDRVAEAETLLRALRLENAQLKAAISSQGASGDDGDDPDHRNRSLRLVALEAERDEVRARLRNLLEAL